MVGGWAFPIIFVFQDGAQVVFHDLIGRELSGLQLHGLGRPLYLQSLSRAFERSF